MVSLVQLAIPLVSPLAVLACEGECITNITYKYLQLYSPVALDIFQNMADKIDVKYIPPSNRRQNAIGYFFPVLDAYDKISYDGLEHAIFPSYFHGKCLYPNGTVPEGCPNPDCPVVCGTPGSLVHFYPVLRQIVFDQTRGQLTNLTSPKSKTYQEVKKMVLADAQKARRGTSGSAEFRAQTTSATEKQFRTILREFPDRMLAACGGKNLSQCSWELYMKEYILQFP